MVQGTEAAANPGMEESEVAEVAAKPEHQAALLDTTLSLAAAAAALLLVPAAAAQAAREYVEAAAATQLMAMGQRRDITSSPLKLR